MIIVCSNILFENIKMFYECHFTEEKKGSHFSAVKDEYGADHASEIHVVGRIVLNLWRLLRHEVNVLFDLNCQ